MALQALVVVNSGDAENPNLSPLCQPPESLFRMSTSTGEAGFCEFCGHAMSEHTDRNISKCLKCKRRIRVCQAVVHGKKGRGWRLCNVPCSCGSTYYPSTALEASPLTPDEYASTHPLYESPPEEGSAPTYVELTKTGDHLQFYGRDDELILTFREHWQATTILYKGRSVRAWQMKDYDTGYSYFTWSLNVADAHPAQSTSSHGRTLSEESIDPLQWTQAQFEANTLTPAMERLTVGSSSSHQAELVLGSARFSSKGTVVFKPEDGGEKVNSLRKCWVKVDGGFIFESEQLGCTYFTKDIKPAKK